MIASILGVFILFQADENRFQFYLDQSDLSVKVERYRDVPDILIRASRYADTKNQWFSLFKRSYISCHALNDYSTFNDLIERSRKFIKAGPEHDALFTASLLWTDQYERAAASLYSIKQPGFETLSAESLLSFEVYRNYSFHDQSPIDFIKEKIGYQEDPDFFRIIGTLADNEVLLYNALLLYMEKGQFQDAENILKGLSLNKISPYRMGIVSYDLGKYKNALEFYQAQDIVDEMKENQRFSMKEQIGDLQYLLGRGDEALASYETGLSLHAEGSWKLYRNIARLYYDRGYSRKAKIILEEGLEAFPNQIELLTDYVLFFAEDYGLIVKKKLEAHISHFPNDMEAKLLKIRYFPDPMNSTQYQAHLWEYFNNGDQDESVARFLLWYLSGLGDSKSLRIVLKRYDYAAEKPHWYLFYEGILFFLEQDIDKALEKMEEASRIFPSWLYERNKSMLNYSLGYLDIAIMQIQSAISDLSKETSMLNGKDLLSDMYVNLGEMYLDQEDFRNASGAFEKSIQFNPDNFNAKSQLNRIK